MDAEQITCSKLGSADSNGNLKSKASMRINSKASSGTHQMVEAWLTMQMNVLTPAYLTPPYSSKTNTNNNVDVILE